MSEVNPEHSKGELVTVATAFNQAEAEFIPDSLAAGPRVIRQPHDPGEAFVNPVPE